MPDSPEELRWLRGEGIDILLSLSEEPPARRWIDEAGLMLVHVPILDFDAPRPDQYEKALVTIAQAKKNGMGINIHCLAGRGRTGTMLAGYFVSNGMPALDAIQQVRSLRPGSIETPEQEQSIRELSRRLQRHSAS